MLSSRKLLLLLPLSASSFLLNPTKQSFNTPFKKYENLSPIIQQSSSISSGRSKIPTKLNFFGEVGKIFEEEGPLGKGITVAKVQVALQSMDRSPSSIFGLLERKARSGGDSPTQLARLGNEVCLALLRKSDDWTAACSSSTWFSGKDAGKAERKFNDLANREATKFEKEYIPAPDSDEKGGGVTLVVVSLVIEIQGDSTNFEGAGFSLGGTKDVLSSIASDCTVDDGYCLNAIEVFWTPSERDEVLSFQDVVMDFPELIDL